MANKLALTAEVARFITRTRPTQIPRNVMHHGKRSLLDGLGLALAGNAAASGHVVRNYLKTLGVPLNRPLPRVDPCGAAGWAAILVRHVCCPMLMGHAMDFG